ncbi:MAG: HPr family phosphocarrier protein [Methylobacterium mesophilicum]|jgi:phosphocarrier protein HPr|nr:HPr family phosphocarrier protein [Methylobacterium mesophilicum]
MTGSDPITREFPIINQRGLHARASAKFIQVAGAFQSEISVERDGMKVGGTSIMGLMMLAAAQGTSVVVTASGPDADDAIRAIGDLILSKFGEEA